MNKFKKFIAVALFMVGIAVLAYYKAKSDLVVKQKEEAILDYYQNVETLLDSLCIYESSNIFNTNVGNNYLESKYKFDSLFINR